MNERMRAARVKLGLSTYQVAEEAGISQSYYSSLENGTRGSHISIELMRRIAKVLGVPWMELFGEGDGRDPSAPAGPLNDSISGDGEERTSGVPADGGPAAGRARRRAGEARGCQR